MNVPHNLVQSKPHGLATKKSAAVKLIRTAFENGFMLFGTAECHNPFINEAAISLIR
jgi:hypothetical protein